MTTLSTIIILTTMNILTLTLTKKSIQNCDVRAVAMFLGRFDSKISVNKQLLEKVCA